LGAHSPPAGYEDVEDDEESKTGGAFDTVDQQMGISHSSGLKIGHEMHIYYQRFIQLQSEQDSDYENAEFFYDDES
jgi:hypothetical protein